ncbi:hypothetical protein [Roseococcus sp.]
MTDRPIIFSAPMVRATLVADAKRTASHALHAVGATQVPSALAGGRADG